MPPTQRYPHRGCDPGKIQRSRITLQSPPPHPQHMCEGREITVTHLLVVRDRCRANLAQIEQSRPESGFGFQEKRPYVVPSSRGSGYSLSPPLFARKRLLAVPLASEALPAVLEEVGARRCWLVEDRELLFGGLG